MSVHPQETEMKAFAHPCAPAHECNSNNNLSAQSPQQCASSDSVASPTLTIPTPAAPATPGLPERYTDPLASTSAKGAAIPVVASPNNNKDDSPLLQAVTSSSSARFHHEEHPEMEEESAEDTYSLLIQTLFVVCCIVAAKICMRRYIPWKGETDLSEISLVFTGLFFILGQMFSNVNADLKEAEKMPMDIVSSLDQLEDSFMLASAKVESKVRLAQVQLLLTDFARTWRDSLMQVNGKTFGDCLNTLSDVVELLRDWDKKGAANTAGVLVVVDKIRRSVARATVIKRTDVLPAARALLNFFILMSSVLLFLASYKTEVGLAVVMACVITVCVFMGRMIAAMDDPFNITKKTRLQKWLKGHMASVQMYPIHEYILRMERKMERELAEMRRVQMSNAAILAIQPPNPTK